MGLSFSSDRCCFVSRCSRWSGSALSATSADRLTLLLLSAIVMRKSPDLINERGRRAENIKGWDKVLMAVYSLLLFSAPVVAGLDAVRFEWSAMPLALHVVGLVGFIPAMVMPLWAMSANAYLSAMVRIQDDRGHQVVTTGPYR